MNKLELRSMVDGGLRSRMGTDYGTIQRVDKVNPATTDPDFELEVEAVGPDGTPRLFRISFREV